MLGLLAVSACALCSKASKPVGICMTQPQAVGRKAGLIIGALIVIVIGPVRSEGVGGAAGA